MPACDWVENAAGRSWPGLGGSGRAGTDPRRPTGSAGHWLTLAGQPGRRADRRPGGDRRRAGGGFLECGTAALGCVRRRRRRSRPLRGRCTAEGDCATSTEHGGRAFLVPISSGTRSRSRRGRGNAISPFQGWAGARGPDPGRGPGLADSAPLGLTEGPSPPAPLLPIPAGQEDRTANARQCTLIPPDPGATGGQAEKERGQRRRAGNGLCRVRRQRRRFALYPRRSKAASLPPHSIAGATEAYGWRRCCRPPLGAPITRGRASGGGRLRLHACGPAGLLRRPFPARIMLPS